jgi:hypothetical protein
MRSRWVGLSVLAVGVALLLGACTWLQSGSLGPSAADPMQTYEVVVNGPLTGDVLAELEARRTVVR